MKTTITAQIKVSAHLKKNLMNGIVITDSMIIMFSELRNADNAITAIDNVSCGVWF